MKHVALILLAGLLAFALFQLGPWQGDGRIDTALVQTPPPVEVPDPGGDLTGTATKAGEAGATDGESPDRKTLRTAEIRVTGRLRGTKDLPVPETEVQLFFGDGSSNRQAAMFRGAEDTKSADVVARSDGSGRFSFVIPAGKGGNIGLGDGDLVFAGRAPRFLGSQADLDLGELPVERGAVLRGRVIADLNDAPLEGVTLRFASYEGFGGFRSGKSDASGAFELRGLPGGNGHLMVSSPGYVSYRQRILMELGKVRDDVLLKLSNGAELTGRVVDDRNRPVAGARVRAQGQGRDLGDGAYEFSNASSETGADGEFRLSGLGQGPYQITANSTGHESANRSKVTLADVPLRLELERRAEVAGRLIDERGEPIAGSRVTFTTRSPSSRPDGSREVGFRSAKMVDASSFAPPAARGRGAQTDADGRFTLGEVKPGRIWLVANGQHKRATQGPIDLAPGQKLVDARIVADRGGVVVVQVIDPEGRPVAKARVTLRSPDSRSGPVNGASLDELRSLELVMADVAGPGGVARGSKVASGVTDEEGRCELAGLDAGSYELTAAHDEWVTPEEVTVKLPGKDKVESQVTMVAGGRVAVRVVDQGGKAVAEQSFRVYVAGAETTTDAKGRQKKPRSVASGRTDATGRATVGPLAPGAYEAVLQLSASGNGMMSMWGMGPSAEEIGDRVPLRVTANEVASAVLTVPKLGSLTGIVSDAGGPVANAELVLMPKKDGDAGSNFMLIWGGTRQVRTDSGGAYTFEALMPGKFAISARRRQGELAFVQEVEIATTSRHHQNLYLSAGVVEIVARLQDKPLAGAKLQLNAVTSGVQNPMHFMGGGANVSAVTDAAGVARFTGVPVGSKYRLSTPDNRYQLPDLDPIEVAVEGVVKREIAVTESASLEVTLVAAAGTVALQMAQVEVKPVGGKAKRSYYRAGGAPHKGSYPAGRYEVRAVRIGRQPGQPEAVWSEVVTLELQAGKPARIQIILP